MLAIAISLLFGFAAVATLAVIHTSVVTGARRARLILAELAAMDRAERAPMPGRISPRPAPLRETAWVLPPRYAAA